MRKLLILLEPQDNLDEPPAVAKKISKIGKTPTRYLGDFRKKLWRWVGSKSSILLSEPPFNIDCNKIVRNSILGGIK